MIFRDQIGETVKLTKKPVRIISLVPSQTELLYDLGLDTRVVGITKFCIYPGEWFRTKTRVGGTKSVDLEKVSELKPDLIIGNKEENTREDIEALRDMAPVWISDVNSLEEALDMIRSIGDLTETTAQAHKLIDEIRKSFEKLNRINNQKVIYYIWNEPDYAVGHKTFIHAMLEACGFQNAVQEDRYPEVVGNMETDLVLLSSEPFPFKEEHIEKFQQKHPGAKIILVDGEMFSWYGSRMRLAPDYFRGLLDSIL